MNAKKYVWKIVNLWPKIKLGSNDTIDTIEWNIGDVDCSSAKYFYGGGFLGFKYQKDIVWYEQKDNNKNIEKVAFLPSGNGIIVYSDGKLPI